MKKFLLLSFLYLFSAVPALADVTSYKACGTVTEDTSVGNNTFTNPGNAGATGATVVTINWSSGTWTSSRIKCTNFNFTTGDIPSGATIDGIEFSMDRQENSTTDNIFNYEVYYIDSSGTLQTGTNSSNGLEWPTGTRASQVFGGASNKMGYTGATDTDMRDADWGISYRVWTNGGSGSTPDGTMNAFKVRVYYTPTAAPDTGSTEVSFY